MEKSKAPQLIIDLIEEAKTAADVTADNALAVRLGWHRQMINHYRLGTKPTNENLLTLCEIAGRDFNTTVIEVEKAFAKSEEAKTRWDNCMKRLGGLAASIALACLLGLLCGVTTIVTSSTAEARQSVGVTGSSLYYVNSATWKTLYSKVQAILRRIRKKCTFRMNIAGIAQMAT